MRCSLQQGFFDRCTSFFAAGTRCRTLSLSLEPARYPDLADTLAAGHLLVGDCPVTTQDFATTPQMRRVLDEIANCPPERSLRRLFLESKALELIVLFCDMLSPAPAAPPLTRDTNACLDKARAFIDARYLHPPTLSQRDSIAPWLQSALWLHSLRIHSRAPPAHGPRPPRKRPLQGERRRLDGRLHKRQPLHRCLPQTLRPHSR